MKREEIIKYCRHLPTCNTMRDWSEAEQALSDTPEKFRDESWQQAVDEMREKRSKCTCGLYELMQPLPPAEGAEEILAKHGFFLIAHKDSNEELRKAFIEPVLAAMQEIATLHAQRIADKMVSERLREAFEAGREYQMGASNEFAGGRENEKPDFNEWINLKSISHD